MKFLIITSISLFFSGLSLVDRVSAQSSTTVTDTTPKYSSICIFNKNLRGMVYGKPLRVINVSSDLSAVVTDHNFTNNFGDFAISLLTNKEKKTPDYFSIWSNNEILVQAENLPHAMSEVFIKINDQEFPLRYSYEGTLGTSCTYGNERISWRRRTEGYQLSEDIKETLRINSGDSNVKIVYYAQSGNQRYKTEFPIGDKTIQSWRRIDKLYHKMAERNKPVENESEESNINTPNVLNDEE